MVFNNGKSYHGSSAVADGGVTGKTDTDYFYFFCPNCEGEQILRLLDYDVHHSEPKNSYDNEFKSKSSHGFTLVFKVHCEQCNLTDFIKISNLGFQEGTLGGKND